MASYLLIFFITITGMYRLPEYSTIQDHEIRKTFSNPIFDGADPWVIKKDNRYYYCYSSGNSIYVSQSPFLTKKGEIKNVWSAPSAGWNKTNIWAPEIHFINNRWYIYYAAGESGPPYIHQKAGVLMSATDDPLGNYTDAGILYTGDNPDLKSENRWAIDLTVFEHNKQLFAVWSGWENDALTDKTSQHLYIAEMADPVSVKSARKKISGPEEPWETGGPLDLQEGPEILSKDGNIFIVYSCRESWTVDYRLGLLKLKTNTLPLTEPSSWEKSGPVFTGPMGVGHCSFTTSPDGSEDWIIYHSKKAATEGWQREIMLQPFNWKPDGYPDFGTPVKRGIEIKRPSGEIEVEKSFQTKY